MSKKLTISTKGHCIDPECKYNTGAIVEAKGSVYDCTLNQTDIGSNKNKFYIMQVIKANNKYIVYIRYGRIGVTGTITYKEFTSESMACGFFEKQFKAKTGNSWEYKDTFVKKDGKYFMAEIETADVSDGADSDNGSDDSEDSKLDDRLVDFLKLISNTTYMKNTLVQLEIDTEKMPLGKISQGQIDKAYELLNEINENLDDDELLIKLSSLFYTLIPYACGRNKPPLINSKKRIGKNIEMLDELSQLVFGTKAVTKLKKDKGNLMKLYEDLHTEITPLDKDDEMYEILVSYLMDSRAPTHNFKFDVLDILEINRQGEADAYDKYSAKIKNKTLLFHGTRVANMLGICTNGLMCDPSRIGISVSITGKMFGQGLYYANSASKSLQYTAHDSSDNIACLFVCEVALGKMLEKKQAVPSLTAKTMPKGYHSTRGVGKSSYGTYDVLEDGVRIPAGKIKPIKENSDSVLLYDEHIIYSDQQVKLRYIIKLKIKDK